MLLTVGTLRLITLIICSVKLEQFTLREIEGKGFFVRMYGEMSVDEFYWRIPRVTSSSDSFPACE